SYDQGNPWVREATMADPKTLLAGVIERAWRDPAFKARLLAQPEAVFAEAGLPVPRGQRVKVVEESETLTYLGLPPPPGEADPSDAQLEAAGGGVLPTLTSCAARISGCAMCGTGVV